MIFLNVLELNCINGRMFLVNVIVMSLSWVFNILNSVKNGRYSFDLVRNVKSKRFLKLWYEIRWRIVVNDILCNWENLYVVKFNEMCDFFLEGN